MKKQLLLQTILLFSIACNAQIMSLGSKDLTTNKNNYYTNQYSSPLFAKNADFFDGNLIKGKNDYAAVHTYLVKDFNGDGFSDLFLSFFSGGEKEKVPFKLFLYDTLSGKMVEKPDLIKNNIGQSFNRKSMAADLNGDNVMDMVCVSHPECQTCEFSYFDILFSDSKTKTWTQKTMKISSRNKGEGYYHGVALGDVDNDGDNDIVLGNENTFSGGTTTMINNGKGEFTEQLSLNIYDLCCFKSGVSWTNELADLNKDGILDLLYWHDSNYRGIAYGDGKGYFGKTIEHRFLKSKYTQVMDYDPVDLDNDGDLDLILTTTDYSSGWELIFYENKGNDADQKVIWIDRSIEINNELRSNGFYSSQETSNWVPYIQVTDINNDGFVDIIPQRPLSNGESPWIVYGQANWSFSHLQLNIPEIPTKPAYKKLDHETTQMTWDKYTQLHPRSSKRIKSWNVYYSNKYFGDRTMVKDKPIAVSLSNYVATKNSVVFDYKFPYPKTYIRITAVDSSGLETPFSQIDSVICSNPPKPTISWNGTELNTAQGLAEYQWYKNNAAINGATSFKYKTQTQDQYKVIVKNASGCTESSSVFDLVITGISSTELEKNIDLYPNPANNYVTIEVMFQPTKPYSIQLINTNGAILDSWLVNERKKTYNIEMLPPGKYFFNVLGENIVSIPFIKQGH